MTSPRPCRSLSGLKRLGLAIAVDDFGTGYSSLNYLKQFPIDVLKIDRSFVDGLPHGEQDAQIARAIIAMAHSLNLMVIAEGVESQAQLDFLREHGCDEVQRLPVRPADARRAVRHALRQRRAVHVQRGLSRRAARLSAACPRHDGLSCASTRRMG